MSNLERSWLFIPLDHESFLEKISLLEADVYILDLEDSVFNKKKDLARENLLKVIEKNTIDKKNIAVRVNHLNTKYGEKDIEYVLKTNIKTIMYPKVESKNDLEDFIKYIPKNEIDTYKLFPAIESIKGLKNIEEIISSNSIIKYLTFGPEDFLSDCGLSYNGFIKDSSLLINVLNKISLLCIEYNKTFIAPPFFNFSKKLEKEFITECLMELNLGAKGKFAVHPKQINKINKLFNSIPFHGNKKLDLDMYLFRIDSILNLMIEKESAIIIYENKLIGIPELKKYSKILKKLSLDYKEYMNKICEIVKKIEDIVN